MRLGKKITEFEETNHIVAGVIDLYINANTQDYMQSSAC